MAQPTPYELKLIQKIMRATIVLESGKKEHYETCSAVDPHMAGKCTCGASEHNTLLDKVILELALS